MKATDTPTRLLRWEEVCELLGISRTTLYELRKQGHLPAVPLPAATGRGAKTSLRWKPSVIEDFIRAQPEA
jgi:excisionase family DNA binding protein